MESKRNTIQRQAVLYAVKELDIHATAEQVYEHIIKSHPSISKATVYRNLSRMAEDGELANIGNFDGSIHYDYNLREHSHFVCEKCKRVFDVNSSFTEIINSIHDMDGFKITGHLLTFSGMCPDCVKAE